MSPQTHATSLKCQQQPAKATATTTATCAINKLQAKPSNKLPLMTWARPSQVEARPGTSAATRMEIVGAARAGAEAGAGAPSCWALELL